MDDRVLNALAMIETQYERSSKNTRDQLNRATVESISSTIKRINTILIEAKIPELNLAQLRLVALSDTLDVCIEDELFTETTTRLKEYIATSLLETRDSMYIPIGKYYEEHDFSYNLHLNKLLTKLVDGCFERGYYFGYDREGV